MKYIWHVSIALFFGYLCGYFVYSSAAIIKTCIAIFAILMVGWIFLRKKREFSVIKIFILLIIVFIYGTVVGNFIKPLEYKSTTVTGSFRIIDKKEGEQTSTYFLQNESERLIVCLRDKTFLLGDKVSVSGKFSNKYIIYPDKDNSKSFDLLDLYRKDGFEYISFDAEVKLLERGRGVSWYTELKNRFKTKIVDIFNSNTNSNFAAVLPAMIFGYEEGISKAKNEEYVRSGLSHILVLSGYNLSILCAFIFYIFRNRDRRIKLSVSLVSIIMFIFVADFGDSFLRAICMTILSIAAIGLSREADSKHFLSLFLLSFIILFPTATIFSVSLHLSVIATVAIIYVYPLTLSFYLQYKNKKDTNIIIKSLILSLSVSILIYPYLAYQFGYINLFAFLLSAASTLFVPFVMLIGFISILLGFFSYALAKIALILAYVPLGIIEGIAALGSQERFVFVYHISFLSLSVAYALIFAAAYFLRFLILYKTDTTRPTIK